MSHVRSQSSEVPGQSVQQCDLIGEKWHVRMFVHLLHFASFFSILNTFDWLLYRRGPCWPPAACVTLLGLSSLFWPCKMLCPFAFHVKFMKFISTQLHKDDEMIDWCFQNKNRKRCTKPAKIWIEDKICELRVFPLPFESFVWILTNRNTCRIRIETIYWALASFIWRQTLGKCLQSHQTVSWSPSRKEEPYPISHQEQKEYKLIFVQSK